MKRLLNTLFITTQGAYLAKEGETIAVKTDGVVRVRFPVHTLDSVVCFGNVSCSPYLMGFCAENDVSISFLSEHGRFLARVTGPVSGNVLLRREQYRTADDLERSTSIARAILMGKLGNSRTVLNRALRDHPDLPKIGEIKDASQRITEIIHRVQGEMTLNEIRGFEGEGAQVYFKVFDHLILSQKEDFRFNGRNRRPPLDNVNCLLSFLYTLVLHDIRSALEGVGLDPAVGYLHRDRPGRPGLALDLMEEFRSVIADRLTLSLINRKQVNQKGFTHAETGAVTMTDETRKAVIVAYQERKQDTILQPYLKEKIPVGLLFHSQALLFARFLRGDIDGYPAFIWS